MRKRRVGVLGRVLAIMAALLLVVIGTSEWLIWNPKTARPESADAIVVLSYKDDRMQEGRKLAAAGVSDQMVVSQSERVRRLFAMGKLSNTGDTWFEECGKQYANYLAHCVVPAPDTTRGEAYAASQLARSEGWDSIVLVTEPSHLRRATKVFERCFDGTIYPVASEPEEDLERKVYRSFYELGSTIMDLFHGNNCL